MDDRKKNIPFRRKPESHSRDSENFPQSGTLHWSPVGECGFAAEILAFATSPIPAKAGISLSSLCNLRRWRGSREIPAFAGMEGGDGNGRRGGNGRGGREWEKGREYAETMIKFKLKP